MSNEETQAGQSSPEVPCSAFLLSRRITDKVVILRKVTPSGSAVDNLTDAEMHEVEIAMRNGGLKMFQPNATADRLA